MCPVSPGQFVFSFTVNDAGQDDPTRCQGPAPPAFTTPYGLEIVDHPGSSAFSSPRVGDQLRTTIWMSARSDGGRQYYLYGHRSLGAGDACHRLCVSTTILEVGPPGGWCIPINFTIEVISRPDFDTLRYDRRSTSGAYTRPWKGQSHNSP